MSTRHVDLDGLDDQDFWKDYWPTGLVATAVYFLPHLRSMPERAGAALSAIVSAPAGGVLFHCMAGRDRTGLVAALLLTAAGVQHEDVVEDYLQTVRLGDVRAAASGRANQEPDLEALCRSHGTTTEGAFRAVIAALDLSPVLATMDPVDRQALRTWRGTLPHAGPIAALDEDTDHDPAS